MHTYESALALIGGSVPGHLAAEMEVPVLTGPQAQGDLLVIPTVAPESGWEAVPPDGIQVIRGEAGGNTHWLHRGFDSPGVTWMRPRDRDMDMHGLAVACLRVPAGQSALLIHTDEHGANGIGPGDYVIKRKREEVPGRSTRRRPPRVSIATCTTKRVPLRVPR